MAQLKFIKEHPNTRQAEVYKTQHAFLNRVARRMSKGYIRHLIEIEALKVYAMNHPGKNSTKLKDDCGLSLTTVSICNIVRREKDKMGQVKNIADLIKQKTHHVLGNSGDDIVVFGLSSSIVFLSQTTLIQGDGTFTCVVLPFTQLYMFHALLRNGVSYPVLYCLVRGKNEEIYKRLLDLVEKTAKERGTTIINRSVRMMVDFELAFINAARPFDAGKKDHLLLLPLCVKHQEEGKGHHRCTEEDRGPKHSRGAAGREDQTGHRDAALSPIGPHHGGGGQHDLWEMVCCFPRQNNRLCKAAQARPQELRRTDGSLPSPPLVRVRAFHQNQQRRRELTRNPQRVCPCEWGSFTRHVPLCH